MFPSYLLRNKLRSAFYSTIFIFSLEYITLQDKYAFANKPYSVLDRDWQTSIASLYHV